MVTYWKTPLGRAQLTIQKEKKRAKQKDTDITAKWLVELFEKTMICTICGREIDNNTLYPNGKHMDHIMPVNIGGKFEKKNIRFIHGGCNHRRPKKNFPKNL